MKNKCCGAEKKLEMLRCSIHIIGTGREHWAICDEMN
jgi:hypothetical protein